jgi:hypothetical protein
MAKKTPIVQGDTLVNQQQGQEQLLVVGTPDWYASLATASTFAFSSHSGTFTARIEQAGNKRGGWSSPLKSTVGRFSGTFRRWTSSNASASMSLLIAYHLCSGKIRHTSCLLIMMEEVDAPLSTTFNWKESVGESVYVQGNLSSQIPKKFLPGYNLPALHVLRASRGKVAPFLFYILSWRTENGANDSLSRRYSRSQEKPPR